MADDQLKQLVTQGLGALKAGSDIAAKATDEIGNDAHDPMLKQALDEGNERSRQWAQRIDSAIQQAGGGGEQDNPILAAHYEVSRRIRQQASDAMSRDLGIIASGQLALHYWIAAFGTLASYAGKLGMSEVERNLKLCVDEAKQGDEQQTKLAAHIMG